MKFLMSILPLLLFMLMHLFCPARGTAEEASALEEIRRAARATQTLSGEFMQVKSLSILDEQLVSKGTFALQKPNMIRWEYVEPFHSLFVINNDDLFSWNEITGKVERLKISGNPAMKIFSEHLLSWAKFDMEYFESHFNLLVREGENVVVVLKPLTSNTIVDKIVVEFGREHIRSLAIFEPGGDFTRIEFRVVRLNQELPDRLFTLP
jgi:outer membrane lipoprotein carrier protein